jgi:hypothetical protein
VVTDENELLLYKFAGFANTGTGNFSASNANIYGVIYPKTLVAIGGKVFLDGKRIYDITFLQKLSSGTLTQKELDSAAKTFGVIPKNEDKVLLDEYAAGKRQTTLIKDLGKKDNSIPEEYIPRFSPQSWQGAFKTHQDKVKTLKDDSRERYRITDQHELLVMMPTARLSALKESNPTLNIPSNVKLISSTSLIFLFNPEIKQSLITINGEIFVGTERFDESKENIRRVYEVDLLLQLTQEFFTDAETFLKSCVEYSVESNDEDKALIDYYQTNKKAPELKVKWRTTSPLSAVSDLSQRQSFKDVRQATDAKGQLSMNGQVSELPLPMFASFDSMLSDSNSKLSSLALKMGSHYVGTVVAGSYLNNPFDSNHFETSAAYGFSFNKGYLEAQMGSFFDESNMNQTLNGQRYQLTLGFDTDYITPFVRILHRAVEQTSLSLIGTGLESKLAKFNLGESTLNANISASYLTNFNGAALGYISCRLESTFSDAATLGLSTDYDTLKGLGLGINLSIDR